MFQSDERRSLPLAGVLMVAVFVLLACWIGLSFVATPVIGRFLTMRETPNAVPPQGDEPATAGRVHRAAR